MYSDILYRQANGWPEDTTQQRGFDAESFDRPARVEQIDDAEESCPRSEEGHGSRCTGLDDGVVTS